MNRKERFYATIERKPVDRPASWLGLPVAEALPALYKQFGVSTYNQLKEKIGDDLSTILMVKPGITGLWQVSGRSDVDFYERVELDVWYIQNWNLWMDLVILLKTVKTVLLRDGAS